MSENNNTQAQSIELVLSPEEVEKQQQAALGERESPFICKAIMVDTSQTTLSNLFVLVW